MTAVIDVCGVMHILLRKEKGHRFQSLIEAADSLIVPDLYPSELSNTFWKFYNKRILTEDECCGYIESGLMIIDEFVESKTLWQDAFHMGVRNNHSIYDMYYAVLAQKNGGVLITDDDALAKICKNEAIACAI